jgi:hypothetical protein
MRQSVEATRLVSIARLDTFAVYAEVLELMMRGEQCLEEIVVGDAGSPVKGLGNMATFLNYSMLDPAANPTEALHKLAYEEVVEKGIRKKEAENKMNPFAAKLALEIGRPAAESEQKEKELLSFFTGGVPGLVPELAAQEKELQKKKAMIMAIIG